MIKRLRERLSAARKKLWKLIRKRHDAKPGGDRRKKLGRKVRATRERKDHLIERLSRLHEEREDLDGLTTVDGKQVATWIAKDIAEARRRGLWDGYVVSGYRSPEYSEQLCYAMCGAPSCPGRCAGRASGHSQKVYPGGCVDVDIAHRLQFAAAMRTIGSPLKNALPTDPNHFSYSGH